MENMQKTTPSQCVTTPAISDEFAHIMDSTIIAYESISEGFGISPDGIDSLIERLHQSLPGLLITNGHVLAVLISELASKATSHDAGMISKDSSSIEQKIDQIAQAYYRNSIWELLASLAHCLEMVEIAHANKLKKQQVIHEDEFGARQTSRAEREFLQQIVNAVRPACKLSEWGYPEATQMIFRRFAELGVTVEQALDLTLGDDRSSLGPFTTERSLLETSDRPTQ